MDGDGVRIDDLGGVSRQYRTRHQQRHRNGTQHLHAPETSESRHRYPVPSRAPLIVQRRTHPLAQASLHYHEQDSANYRQTARTIPRPPEPRRTAANLPVCIARMRYTAPEKRLSMQERNEQGASPTPMLRYRPLIRMRIGGG